VPVPADHRIASGQSKAQPVGQLSLEEPKKKTSKKRWLLWGVIGALCAGLLIFIAAYFWYQQQLAPVSNTTQATRVRVAVKSGMTPEAIATLLEKEKVIRSKNAFMLYTRLTRTQGKLQAGTYSLATNESTPTIVNHLVSGKVDVYRIKFLPGATLKENRKVLIGAGFSESEVDTALAATYDHPLFDSKPASADLEGYIYGDTYEVYSDASAQDILKKTFDEFYGVVKKDNLVEGFKKQGLTLYQGIIMASIIQREVPHAADQKQVAQVFYKRYNEGMSLGSDITAYYGADKIGVERSVSVDTPYNTRIHPGLPPGPIATPGLTALQAAAAPAPGDYLFFLSGDDEVTYFARTNAEHEANIRKYCTVKCAME
jgi:UPF0755 protein